MQIELDEKLIRLDTLHHLAGQLLNHYRIWQNANFTEEGRPMCLALLKKLSNNAKSGNELPGDFLANLEQLFRTETDTAVFAPVEDVLSQLCDTLKKMYLACMHDENSYKKVMLPNYFNTAFTKKALLVYLVYPFLFPDAPPGHTNQPEARLIAELLKEFCYDVDIVNTKYHGEIPHEYDLIIGQGSCFERLCPYPGAASVYYLTESSPYFANRAELARLRDFERRNGVKMPFERQSPNLLNLPLLYEADAAICIGNRQTLSTYEGMFQKIYPLNATGFTGDFTTNPQSADVTADRIRSFLWYGGAGPIHKGLDLLIETFRELPDLKLHIVGELPAKFYQFYQKDIEQGENILYYGFLGKDSPLFSEVCKSCGFCLSPSCSEGQSTSVITTMFAGMIPVCTKENGIDLELCGGIEMTDITPEALREQIRALSLMSPGEFSSRSSAAYSHAKECHSLEAYRTALQKIFEEIGI